MQKILLGFCLLMISLSSCQQEAPQSNDIEVVVTKDTLDSSKVIAPIDTLDSNLKKIQGFWIMSEYIDGILKRKTIVGHTFEFTSLAIILRIKGDSLLCVGSSDSRKIHLTTSFDSLVSSGKNLMYLDNYQLNYDEVKDIIFAKQVNTNLHPNEYSFRRLKESENRLVDNIVWRNGGFYHELMYNFHSFFADSLLRGEYKPLSKNDKESLVIGESIIRSGKMSGFKDYKEYHIHEYFALAHPYQPEDAIIFTGGKNYTSGIYNWKIKQDTLELTEMHPRKDDGYFYELGTKKYRFVKIKNH